MRNTLALIAPDRRAQFVQQRRCPSGATNGLVYRLPAARATPQPAVDPYAGLRPSEGRLLQYLTNLAAGERKLPSIGTIAGLLKVSEHSLSRAAQALGTLGIITIGRNTPCGRWECVTITRTGQVVRRGGEG